MLDILQLQIVVLLSPLELLLGVVLTICLILLLEEVVFQKTIPDFERPEVSCSSGWPENMQSFVDSIANIFWNAI